MSESKLEMNRKRELLAKADVKLGDAAKRNARREVHANDIGSFGASSIARSADMQVGGDIHMPEFNSNGSCAPGVTQADIEKGLILIHALRDALD